MMCDWGGGPYGMTGYYERREPEPRDERVEEVARSLNDDWAAGSSGARWDALDETEREHWRKVARTHIG